MSGRIQVGGRADHRRNELAAGVERDNGIQAIAREVLSGAFLIVTHLQNSLLDDAQISRSCVEVDCISPKVRFGGRQFGCELPIADS